MTVPFVTPIAHYFGRFRKYTGNNLIALVGLASLGSLIEGFGITLIFPVLTGGIDGTGEGNRLAEVLQALFRIAGLDPSLNSALVLMIVLFSAKGLFEYGRLYLDNHLSNQVGEILRLRLLEGVGGIEYLQFTKNTTGNLTTVAGPEVVRTINAFGVFTIILAKICTVTGLIAVSIGVNPTFTAIALGVGFSLSFVLRFLTAKAKHFSKLTTKLNVEFQTHFIQAIQSFKYLTATGLFPLWESRMRQNIRSTLGLKRAASRAVSLRQAAIEPILVLVLSGLIYWQSSIKGLAIPTIVVSLLLFQRILSFVMELQAYWFKFNNSLGSVDLVFETVEELDRARRRPSAGAAPEFRRAIEFRAVDFDYPGKPVLRSLDLTIPRLSTIALVGESGAGKTTVVDLIAGLIEPLSGKILIDGRPLEELDLDRWRNRIGYVTQDPPLYSGTILENIAVGADPADPEVRARAERVAKLAHASGFIAESPLGYDTPIGDRGTMLSGGQRQRIALARELFREPDLLFLDEATSALDSETENLVRESLVSLKGRLTIVVIAHRLSSIRDVDRIFVLGGGKVVENGTYRELHDRIGSRFRSMCESQGVSSAV